MKSFFCVLLLTTLTTVHVYCEDKPAPTITNENQLTVIMKETPEGTTKKITIECRVAEKKDLKTGTLYCMQIGNHSIPGLPDSYKVHTGKTITVEVTLNHCPMFKQSQKAGFWVGEVNNLVKVH